MTTSRNLVTELSAATQNQWGESIRWFFFVGFGGLLPIWAGYLVLQLFSMDTAFSSFAGSGEFALYSAALITPALYLISRDVNEPFVHRGFFILVGVIGLALSVLLYSVATTAGLSAEGASDGASGIWKLDKKLVILLSSLLLGFSALFAFLVNLLDTILIGFDPRATAKAEQSSIETAYKQAGGDDDAEDD